MYCPSVAYSDRVAFASMTLPLVSRATSRDLGPSRQRQGSKGEREPGIKLTPWIDKAQTFRSSKRRFVSCILLFSTSSLTVRAVYDICKLQTFQLIWYSHFRYRELTVNRLMWALFSLTWALFSLTLALVQSNQSAIQSNLSAIQSNLSTIQSNLSTIQSNLSASSV